MLTARPKAVAPLRHESGLSIDGMKPQDTAHEMHKKGGLLKVVGWCREAGEGR